MSASDLSASVFLDRIGCQLCQRRPRGSGGWVIQPCRSCRVARSAGPPKRDYVTALAEGSALWAQVAAHDWVVTLDELAGYLAKKVTAAPWAAIDWGAEGIPKHWHPLIEQAMRESESFGGSPLSPGDQTYLCPRWLSLFLAAGTWVWKLKGVTDARRPNWPQVLTRACSDDIFRKGLETCIMSALATAPDNGGPVQPATVVQKLFPRGQDEASKNQRARAREYVAPRIIELIQTAHPELLGVERARKVR